MKVSEHGETAGTCRLCGGSRTRKLGKIPDCGEFAGQAVTPTIEGGYLIECLDCASLFRSPLLSPARYIDMYQRAPGVLWSRFYETRNDFRIVADLLSDTDGGEILDIGCYSGVFLRSLPDKFKKFGVEPSDSAAAIAQSQGIAVLGKTLSQIDPDRQFDVVTAIDVIEHLIDVPEFLGEALQHIKDRGLLIISSGNPDCLYWKKIYKARFWYVSYAEHLTFPSFRFYTDYAQKAGIPPPRRIRFPYLKRPFGLKTVLFFAHILFSFSPALFRSSERLLRKMTGMKKRLHNEFGLSVSGVFADHQVLVIKKESGAV